MTNTVDGSADSGAVGSANEALSSEEAAGFDIEAGLNALIIAEQKVKDLLLVIDSLNNVGEMGVASLEDLSDYLDQMESTDTISVDDPMVEDALSFLLLNTASIDQTTGVIILEDGTELTDLNEDGSINHLDLIAYYDADQNGKIDGNELSEQKIEYGGEDGVMSQEELQQLYSAVERGMDEYQSATSQVQQLLQFHNSQYQVKWEAFTNAVKAFHDGIKTAANNAR